MLNKVIIICTIKLISVACFSILGGCQTVVEAEFVI